MLGSPPFPLSFGHTLASLFTERAGLVVLTVRGLISSFRPHPLWWPATSFAATDNQAFESQYSRFDLFAFSPELLQNLVNVHRLLIVSHNEFDILNLEYVAV